MAIQAHPVPMYPYAPIPPAQGTSMESVPVQPNSNIPVRLPIFAVPLVMHDIVQRIITGIIARGEGGGGKLWSFGTWRDVLGESAYGFGGTTTKGLESIEEGVDGDTKKRAYGEFNSSGTAWRSGGAHVGTPAYPTTTRLRHKKLE